MHDYASAERDSPARRRRQEPPPLHPLLALQQAAGNQAVARQLARLAAPPGEERIAPAIEMASIAELKTMLEDLQGFGSATVRLPLETITVNDAVKWRFRVRAKLHARSMEALTSSRLKLFVMMQSAGTDEERRKRTKDLRAHDAPYLADIRSYAFSPQTRFRHEDPVVQDGVLAAIQLEAVADAEGDLANPKDAHKKSYEAAGMAPHHDWCGFFALEKYMTSNLDRELREGYFHTNDIERLFTYTYVFGKDSRSKKWIYADGQWHDVRAYHAARGSQRQWIPAERFNGRASLDIRPGDIITIDHSKDPTADHIMMVHSFDAATNTVFTIGGNDGGYDVDPNPKHPAPHGETEAARVKRERLEASTGQPLRAGTGGGKVGVNSYKAENDERIRLRIFGIGRQSLVDFEDHRYDSLRADRPPATL